MSDKNDFDKYKLENLNKETVGDPLAGGTMDVYTSKDGTFMMQIPHQCVPLPPEHISPKYKWTDNPDGSKTWERLKD